MYQSSFKTIITCNANGISKGYVSQCIQESSLSSYSYTGLAFSFFSIEGTERNEKGARYKAEAAWPCCNRAYYVHLLHGINQKCIKNSYVFKPDNNANALLLSLSSSHSY